MASTKELRERRGQLNNKFKEIIDRAEAEDRELTAEEDAVIVQINADDQALKNRIDKQEALALRSAELSAPIDRSGRRIAGGDGEQLGDDEMFNVALRGWMANQLGHNITDEQAAACAAYGFNPSAQRLNLNLTNNWQYERASWRTQNAMKTKLPGKGGAWIAPMFVQNLEWAMLEHGPMLQVAELLNTQTGAEMSWPTVNDTSNRGEMVAEMEEAGEGDINAAATVFRAHEMTTKVVVVSQAMMDDSAFDISGMISTAFGERIGRGMNYQTTLGNGANTARGIVPSAVVGKDTASATAITAEEVLDLIYSVNPAYRSNPSFRLMANDKIWLALRKLKGTDGQFLWQPSLQEGQPDRFSGYVIVANDDMTDTLAAGNRVMLAGAMSSYKIRRVRQVYLRRMTEKYATKNADGFVAFVRFDGALLDAGTNPIKCLRMKPS